MLRRRKNAAPPALNDNTDPADWTYRVEAIEPSVVLGRYRVYLTVSLFMRYGGNDGWGWTAWTLAGAHRKGARELARYRRRQAALAVRQARVDVGDRS